MSGGYSAGIADEAIGATPQPPRHDLEADQPGTAEPAAKRRKSGGVELPNDPGEAPGLMAWSGGGLVGKG